MIIYTCPECGHDLLREVLTCYPPINKDYCPNCGWSHSEQEEIIRIPFGGNSLNMRNATSEERESIQNHINDISIETGVNFFDIQNELEKYEKTLSFMNKIGL